MATVSRSDLGDGSFREGLFLEAVREARLEDVRKYLDAGVSPDCPTQSQPAILVAISTLSSPRGSTGLEERMISVLTLLFERGAASNCTVRGMTPLHRAAMIRNADVAERVVGLLLKNGASPTAPNEKGELPEEVAATHPVRILLLRSQLSGANAEVRRLRAAQGPQKSKFCALL